MSEITLKEFFEAKLHAIEKLREKDIKAFYDYVKSQSVALELQAREYERRLDALNNEHGRIAKTQETYVSREIWERFVQERRDFADEIRTRLARFEIQITAYLPRQEFQTYKETTDKALTLKAGQTQGFDSVRAALTFVAGIVVAAVALWAATKGLR